MRLPPKYAVQGTTVVFLRLFDAHVVVYRRFVDLELHLIERVCSVRNRYYAL